METANPSMSSAFASGNRFLRAAAVSAESDALQHVSSVPDAGMPLTNPEVKWQPVSYLWLGIGTLELQPSQLGSANERNRQSQPRCHHSTSG